MVVRLCQTASAYKFGPPTQADLTVEADEAGPSVSSATASTSLIDQASLFLLNFGRSCPWTSVDARRDVLARAAAAKPEYRGAIWIALLALFG